MKKCCERCGKKMQGWGRTKAGTLRFFCPVCKTTATRRRKDLSARHIRQELDLWLDGREPLKVMAREEHKTRQALWKEFRPLMDFGLEQKIPKDLDINTLIVDGTYIHGHVLCALIGIDEHDNIFWKFAPYESYLSWHSFLAQFPQPKVVVMDGQKGLFSVVRLMWPSTKIQRCQFHVVSFALQYLGRRPKDEAGQVILDLLYRLKTVKTPEARDEWLFFYRIWERQYGKEFTAKNISGQFLNPRLRSVRYILRRAIPYLFTYIDNPGTPNTTNLVEGWINGAIAEALRRHRGLRAHEKKTLVSIVLSHLSRGNHALPEDLPHLVTSIKLRSQEEQGSEVPF